MRLRLVPKNELPEQQRQHIDTRLAAPEHQFDGGPAQCWKIYASYLYAFVHRELNLPIAIAEASGRPTAVPGWWIDSQFRGQGYGYELVDLLAAYLKADGATDIGRIPIDTYNGVYNEQSTKLAKRLRERFAKA